MSMRKKRETIDLDKLGLFLGISDKTPSGRRAKRTVPRGELDSKFWNSQFEDVVDKIEGWGYSVELVPRVVERVELGEVKTVYVNSSTHPETRLYTLLHEVGHIIIRRQWEKFAAHHPYYLLHPDYDQGSDSRRMRGKAYRVGLVAEEIKAWEEGLKFAKKMRLFIDPLKFDADKNEALISYIWWAGDVCNEHHRAAKTRQANAKAKSKARKSNGSKGLQEKRKK